MRICVVAHNFIAESTERQARFFDKSIAHTVEGNYTNNPVFEESHQPCHAFQPDLDISMHVSSNIRRSPVVALICARLGKSRSQSLDTILRWLWYRWIVPEILVAWRRACVASFVVASLLAFKPDNGKCISRQSNRPAYWWRYTDQNTRVLMKARCLITVEIDEMKIETLSGLPLKIMHPERCPSSKKRRCELDSVDYLY